MCVRPHTSDDKAVAEVFRGYYGWREWRPRAGDRYLDLGMNIGAVFCWASKYGVHAYLGVEMEYDNVRVASRNLARALSDLAKRDCQRNFPDSQRFARRRYWVKAQRKVCGLFPRDIQPTTIASRLSGGLLLLR